MRKHLLGSIALSAVLLTGITGCGSNSTTSTKSTLDLLISDLEESSKSAIAASLVDVNDSDKIPFGDGSFSPFERVAVLPVVKDKDGNVDYNATNTKAIDLAHKFALSVANINEPQEDSVTFKASNWIVIDKKKVDVNLTVEDIKGHLIHIPTSKPFNPNYKYSKTNTN